MSYKYEAYWNSNLFYLKPRVSTSWQGHLAYKWDIDKLNFLVIDGGMLISICICFCFYFYLFFILKVSKNMDFEECLGHNWTVD